MDAIRNDWDLSLHLLFTKIDALLKENERVIFAIDGRSGSGKTTIAEAIRKKYGCTVIHMDDFFLRPEQRTKERYAEAGGNVDRERFLSEVLIPLSRGESLTYRPFDCAAMNFAAPVSVIPTPLTVVEGVYSMYPDLCAYYNGSLFMTLDKDLQRERILSRNSKEMAQRFFNDWIPMEEQYFSHFGISGRCDRIITVKSRK